MSLNTTLLTQSFAQIKPQAERFTADFYQTLFAHYPETQPLFAHTSMQTQAKKLFDSLVLVVDSLQKPEILSTSFKSLGTRHIQYGVLPHHYPMVGTALLKTLEQYLTESWTPELNQAWADAYAAVTELMLEGADYSADVLEL